MDGTQIGRVHDLVARLEGSDSPPVDGIVIRPEGGGSDRLWTPNDMIRDLGPKGVRLAAGCDELAVYEQREGQVRLAKDVIDRQVVDVRGRTAPHVNDLTLEPANPGWRLAGVDVSPAAFFARVSLGWLARRMRRNVIPWNRVQFFAGQVSTHTAHVKYDRLASMHPMDIAQVISQLSYHQGSEALAGLGPALAANVLPGVLPALQTAIIQAMPRDQAAAILNQMPPDKAVNLLSQMHNGNAQDLIGAMNPDDAAEIKYLLDFPQDTAGGMMTIEYVAIPCSFTVQQAIDHLRSYEWLPDFIYYVFVLESLENGKLKGVITLRDLFLAEAGARVADLMQPNLITAQVTDRPQDVSRKLAHYDLIALPVLDEEDKLCGVITVDAAMDMLLPEAWQHRVPRMFR